MDVTLKDNVFFVFAGSIEFMFAVVDFTHLDRSLT